MCGRFNLVDSPEVRELMRRVNVHPGPLRFASDIAPGSTISIINDIGAGPQVSDAIWWLLLDRETLKPDYRYVSFNSRHDKLNKPRSLAYRPFRESRCIIPASAFIEGLGDRKTYHKVELEGQAIAFGGLYRAYVNPDTGKTATGASIITLPPPPQWSAVHPKSMPLMLPIADQELLHDWLDPGVNEVEKFDWLLEPAIRVSQVLTPIGRPGQWNEIGEPSCIAASMDTT